MIDILNNKEIERTVKDVLCRDFDIENIIEKDIEEEWQYIDEEEYTCDGEYDVFPEVDICEYTIKVDTEKNVYIISGKAVACYEVDFKGVYGDEDVGGYGTVYDVGLYYDLLFNIIIHKGIIIEKSVKLIK